VQFTNEKWRLWEQERKLQGDLDRLRKKEELMDQHIRVLEFRLGEGRLNPGDDGSLDPETIKARQLALERCHERECIIRDRKEFTRLEHSFMKVGMK
jgi:hypothetical protein